MTAPSRPRRRRVVFLPSWPDNPYQILLAAALGESGLDVDAVSRRLLFLPAVLRHGRPAIVHQHAPDHFVVYRRSWPAAAVALVLYVAQILLLRLVGVRIVWTVHDLMNHERRRPRLDRLVRRISARLAHARIVHCQAARLEVAAVLGLPAARFAVVPHGHYADHYPGDARGREEARAALQLADVPVLLLFLGNLRRHKGLDALFDAFARLDREGVRLVVAGAPFDAATGATLAARAAGCRGVELRAGTVPDDAIATYMRAADVVVCPFTSSLTSGSLALAMSFGKPVVASRLGCVAEMVAVDGAFLYDAGDDEGLLHALRAAVDGRASYGAMGDANRRRVQAHDWATIARQTVAVYDAAIG